MKECIILAGGLGTRLQSVVSDRPKCMALVAGKPFLMYMFDYLKKEGFNHVILSLGYKSEVVLDWLKSVEYPFMIDYVIEKEPLGTGGAIKYAAKKSKTNRLYIFNGDTFFKVDTEGLSSFHEEKQSDISLALKPMREFDRYGAVEIDKENRILIFKEKQFQEEGFINGGVYVVNKEILDTEHLPDVFSFEKDILESKLSLLRIFGSVQDKYFIDIGIPTDYEKANIDFRNDDN